MVPFFVPVIKETIYLVSGYAFQKTADLGVTVYLHPVRKQGMVKRKIRIILACVFLFNNQIGNQVHEKSGITAKVFLKHGRQFVLIKNLFDHNVGTDLQSTASVSFRKFLRQVCVREIHLVLLVGEHAAAVGGVYLANDYPLWNGILFVGLVFLPVLEQDISRATLFLGKDFALHWWYCYW